VLEKIDSGKSPVCLDRKVEGDEWGVLKLGAVTWGTYKDEENKALPSSVAPDPALEVKPGDLLFTRKNTRELVGASAYVYSTRPRLLLSDLIFRLRIRPDCVLPQFLHRQLSMPSKRRMIQMLAGGSAGSMPNISKARLAGALIELPPLEHQGRFVQRAEALRSTSLAGTRGLAELDALFSSLQHRAFRGDL
jgi:type I restriction enzyme S subunit